MCSNLQCKKQTLMSKCLKAVCFCYCQRFFLGASGVLSQRKVRLPVLSPLGGLWRWLPKCSRFDFSIGRRCWSCASDRMQPRLGGALHSCEHVQPCVHTNMHKWVFLKSCPCRVDRALVPSGREELWFFSFLFVFMSHPVWWSPFHSPLFFVVYVCCF